MNDNPRLALLDTSHRAGWVALALGDRLLASRPLQEARRHARDLAPMLAQLLAEQGWRARELDGVIVSRGPGSYTGLRVGLMSAKTLAYAAGCALLAVDTFAVIAAQTPITMATVDILADAQQDRIYVQRFIHDPSTTCQQGFPMWQSSTELRIVKFADWVSTLDANVFVSGAGLEIFAPRLPAKKLVPREHWLASPQSLLRLGLERMRQGGRDDPFAVEPLYLRPSSAEEKFSGSPSTLPR